MQTWIFNLVRMTRF